MRGRLTIPYWDEASLWGRGATSQERGEAVAWSFLVLSLLSYQHCRDVGGDACVHLELGQGCRPGPRDSWGRQRWSPGCGAHSPCGRRRSWVPRGFPWLEAAGVITLHRVLVLVQFCGTIVLIFFLELAVAVLAFLFQDWVRDRFREFFESNIRSYRDDIDLQNLIDSLQKAVGTPALGALVEHGGPQWCLLLWAHVPG